MKSWGAACVLVATLGCSSEEAMREACNAAVFEWHLPRAESFPPPVEGYVDQTATRALVAAAGLTCNEWCQQNIPDSATLKELVAAGLMNAPAFRFQHTVWASAAASREIGEWETNPHCRSQDGGRRLCRLENVARLSVVVDEVPGGLTGEARCWIIEDPESGEWWFWGWGGDWFEKADPWIQVYSEYDPFLARAVHD